MGKNTIISQWIVRCLHIISNGKWNQITLTWMKREKETRKCMLRPNSFSLLSALLHESTNHRPNTFDNRMHHFVSHIVVAIQSNIFFFHNTHADYYYLFRGVIRFYFFFSLISPSLAFYFDFGTFEMFKWMKYKAKKKYFWHTMRTRQKSKKKWSKEKKIWTLCVCASHSEGIQSETLLLSHLADDCFFHFWRAAASLSNSTYSFCVFSVFSTFLFSPLLQNVIIFDDKLHMCVVSMCRGWILKLDLFPSFCCCWRVMFCVFDGTAEKKNFGTKCSNPIEGILFHFFFYWTE